MREREQLELAAKAAGIEIEWGIVENGKVLAPPEHAYMRDKHGIRWRWNPREDDAQALQLVVALNMGVKCNGPDHWQEPNCTIVIWEDDCARRICWRHGKDKASSTRQAILRAAARAGANDKSQQVTK